MISPVQTSPAPPSRPGSDYERADVNVRQIAFFAVLLGVLVVAASSAMIWLFGALARERAIETRASSPFAEQRPLPPEPRLQINAAADLAELRQREKELLTEYRWVDRPNGVVAIPIERAMELLIERGTLNQEGGSDVGP